jgi:hypothetical protein
MLNVYLLLNLIIVAELFIVVAKLRVSKCLAVRGREHVNHGEGYTV